MAVLSSRGRILINLPFILSLHETPFFVFARLLHTDSIFLQHALTGYTHLLSYVITCSFSYLEG